MWGGGANTESRMLPFSIPCSFQCDFPSQVAASIEFSLVSSILDFGLLGTCFDGSCLGCWVPVGGAGVYSLP